MTRLCARIDHRFIFNAHHVVSLKILQDLRLEPLASYLHQSGVWNEYNQVPKHLWLEEAPSEDHDSRMKVLGNLVVPCCAKLGASIALGLAKSYDQEA